MTKSTSRLAFSILAIVVLAAAAWFSSNVISKPETLNAFSYWGTVATLLALLLAITELVHSIQITKSLQQQTAAAIEAIRRVEDASILSDCIAAIDITAQDVLSERYDAALGAYQNFRKLCVRVIPGFGTSSTSDLATLNKLGQLELKIASATRVNASAGLSKPQKRELMELLLLVKQSVEHHNPANRK